jgi:hypothetical protein
MHRRECKWVERKQQ